MEICCSGKGIKLSALERMKKLISGGETRAAPEKKSGVIILGSEMFDDCGEIGYIPLAQNPEIMAAVGTVADIISSMTIYLMENTEQGDKRVRDGLARIVDIEPNSLMTRKTFMYNIVRTMLLEGKGNAYVLPIFSNGYLKEFEILKPSMVSTAETVDGYKILYGGQEFYPDEVLHFPYNPKADCPWKGTGIHVQLKSIAKSLNQETKTKNDFLSSEYKPSIAIKVDSNAEELADPDSREEFAQQYLKTKKAGEPWMIPAELMEIQSVKPLTLNELAISETIEIDKKTAAAIVGVPAFLLGVGDFKQDEWNNFISTKIKFICEIITQEMTKKLLISPNRYWKFNMRSLYSYDIKTLFEVGKGMYTVGLAEGNEVRDWMDMSPKEGLDKLVILENFIPVEKIGDQNKLKGGEEG